jgi:hypothetical protein
MPDALGFVEHPHAVVMRPIRRVLFAVATVALCGGLGSACAQDLFQAMADERSGEHTMHDFRIVLLSAQGLAVRSIDKFDQDLALLLR